jgi:hypothetical protein
MIALGGAVGKYLRVGQHNVVRSQPEAPPKAERTRFDDVKARLETVGHRP